MADVGTIFYVDKEKLYRAIRGTSAKEKKIYTEILYATSMRKREVIIPTCSYLEILVLMDKLRLDFPETQFILGMHDVKIKEGCKTEDVQAVEIQYQYSKRKALRNLKKWMDIKQRTVKGFEVRAENTHMSDKKIAEILAAIVKEKVQGKEKYRGFVLGSVLEEFQIDYAMTLEYSQSEEQFEYHIDLL